MKKSKITHVLTIKDGSGLEEESHMRITITTATPDAATAAVAAATTIYSLLFLFFSSSTGQSISHL